MSSLLETGVRTDLWVQKWDFYTYVPVYVTEAESDGCSLAVVKVVPGQRNNNKVFDYKLYNL